METLKLGIFDLDGTIRHKTDGVPPEVRDGMEELWASGITTTIATGRGYARLREALGSEFDSVVSQDAPISLENGGRLTTNAGENIRYYPLTDSDIESTLAAVDAGNREAVMFVAYFPQEPKQKAVIWVNNEGRAEEFTGKYGHFADVTSEPFTTLQPRIVADRACMLMVRTEPGVQDARTWFTGANSTFNEGEFNIMAPGITKARGVTDLADVTGVSLSEIFVAGNDENDAPMFDLPVERKIFVHGETTGIITVPSNAIEVVQPEGLGNYLKTMISPK